MHEVHQFINDTNTKTINTVMTEWYGFGPNPECRPRYCRRAVSHQRSPVLLVFKWRLLDCIQLCISSMHANR